MDDLKREKEKDKAFHCDDIALIKSEICGISKRQIFNMKKACTSTKSRTRSPLP